jgi:ABC-type sulfate transport system permease subunit
MFLCVLISQNYFTVPEWAREIRHILWKFGTDFTATSKILTGISICAFYTIKSPNVQIYQSSTE